MRRKREHRWTWAMRSVADFVINPFRFTANLIRVAQRDTTGNGGHVEQWPAPVPSAMPLPTRQPTRQAPGACDAQPPTSGFFRLPLEVRIAIYDLVFPFPEIHISKTCYTDISRTKYRLESFPCDAEPKYKTNYMCTCCIRYIEGWRRGMPYTACFPKPRPMHADSDAAAGLWEIQGLTYTSRAFCDDMRTFVNKHRTFQFFDLESIILFGVTMPRIHFQFVRSLYLNAKYIAQNTSFTYSIDHLPSSYFQRFCHLPVGPLPISSRIHYRPGLALAFKREFIQPTTPHYPSAWYVACYIISQMQSLHVLRIQLCHSAFSDVLFEGVPERVISNENWVFEPLIALVKERDKKFGIFEVEVDWPDGGDGWDEVSLAENQRGFDLRRIGPRARGW